MGWGRCWRSLRPQQGAQDEHPAEPRRGCLHQEPPPNPCCLLSRSVLPCQGQAWSKQRRSSPPCSKPVAAETSLYPSRILAGDLLPATAEMHLSKELFWASV